MDTEEGVEVVWNEAVFSGTKKIKTKEEAKLKDVFEALTLIDHPNIVKFHRYWTDAGGTFNEKSGQTSPPRVSYFYIDVQYPFLKLNAYIFQKFCCT